MCDAERFCVALKMIAIECNLETITYDKLGILSYQFKDGSKVGDKGAWIEAGVLKQTQ